MNVTTSQFMNPYCMSTMSWIMALFTDRWKYKC